MKIKMILVAALALTGLLATGCAHHRSMHEGMSCGCSDKTKMESCGKDHKDGKCSAGATEAAKPK